MIDKNHITSFSKELTEILNREIKLGNQIAETSKGWPQEDAIIIFLDKPFKKQYKFENIEFRNIDDPHYWKAEYYDKSNNHILACKF
ncbi:hypothetical protein [Epilithonimonas hispanica]|uniref:Uncharacterized protein n=1 Tax=Epilithonimonas hispanica TaxID=358687 RepID=A0A3D9D072_9FLAO|nr:hypothetical protein [Epilithonimonas hispanica]REC71420.1 hypothetical protein DRF58_06285 [Epilithonimonas hispanica]